jgi:hypothetical protein
MGPAHVVTQAAPGAHHAVRHSAALAAVGQRAHVHRGAASARDPVLLYEGYRADGQPPQLLLLPVGRVRWGEVTIASCGESSSLAVCYQLPQQASTALPAGQLCAEAAPSQDTGLPAVCISRHRTRACPLCASAVHSTTAVHHAGTLHVGTNSSSVRQQGSGHHQPQGTCAPHLASSCSPQRAHDTLMERLKGAAAPARAAACSAAAAAAGALRWCLRSCIMSASTAATVT